MGKVLEQLPESLKKEYTPLKKNEKRVYKLNGIFHDKETGKDVIPLSVAIPTSFEVSDPETGDVKSIHFITRDLPAGSESQRDTIKQLGRILFTREGGGQITISGNRPGDKTLDEFLFFSAQNEYNKDKKWHIAPEYGYKFHLVDNTSHAKKEMDQRRKVRQADGYVDEMPESEVIQMAKGLWGDYKNHGIDVLRKRLSDMAQKNPDHVLKLSKDETVKYQAKISEFKDADLIAVNQNKTAWIWPDSGETLCSIKPGENAVTSLKNFFIGDGAQTYSALVKMLEGQDNKDEGKDEDQDSGNETESTKPSNSNKTASNKKATTSAKSGS